MSSPIRNAGLGVLALIVILISSLWLARLSSLGNVRLDLTEDKVHTLSAGTKEILSTLEAPVVIRYYASRNSEGIPRDFKLYMRRVDDFLSEYKAIAGEKIMIERIDPQPDTDAEDQASLDEVVGQRLNEYDNFFLGISVSCFEKKKSLPFLNPAEETLLEYKLSSAIAEVATLTKTKIGIMSAFALEGSVSQPQIPGMPPQQPQPEWVIHQQLKESYDLQSLGLNPEGIPQDITTILLVHPAGISERTEFLLDQFILKGGRLIALVDPGSVIAPTLSGAMAQFGGGIPAQSDLPTLFKHWGVEFTHHAIADSSYKRSVQGGRVGAALLALNKDAFVQNNELLTRDLNDMLLIIPGGFRYSGSLNYTPLVQSSPNSYKVDPQKALQLDQSLVGIRPDEFTYDFVARLTGEFTTAFPNGDPSQKDLETDDQPQPLKKSEKSGAVFLVADSDWIYDQFSFSQNTAFGNMRIVQPTNGNSSLFLNMIDQVTGSTSLIGARSRSSSTRPFKRIEEMKAQAEERVGEKVRQLQAKQQEAEQRINILQTQKKGSDRLFLSPEQEQEIRDFRAKNIQYRREIRDLQKELKSETDALEGKLLKLNVILMPLLVSIGGFIFLKLRSRKTTAA